MGHGGRPKADLVLSTEERLALERLANRRKSAQAMAMRARIVMCCAKDGATNRDVATKLGVSEAMVKTADQILTSFAVFASEYLQPQVTRRGRHDYYPPNL
jgi:Trp operon repressor